MRKPMSYTKFCSMSRYMNLSAVSRAMGKNRLYLVDVGRGRIKYTKQIGMRINRILGI
jgi:hypothetical protein